jgi:hypothetical protein
MGGSFVSKTVVVEEEIMQWTTEEKKETSSRYGCEILFERTTLSQVKDPSLPNDAYLILYRVNDETYVDLCRGTRVKIFDMYYDKFGPGSVQKIDFGYGRVSPKVWGYRAPEKKRRK